MITRTVNVLVEDQNGVPYADAIITAVLDRTDLDPDSGYVVPAQATFRSDVNGEAVMELWPNARGDKGSRYRVTATTTNGKLIFDVWATVPDVDGSMLEDISEPVSCDGPDCTVSGSAGGGTDGDTAVAEHEAKLNPHPQYATGGAQDSHSGRIDNPHGVTAAQAGADPAGSAAAAEQAANNYTDQQVAAASGSASQALSDHEGAANPHPQYATGGVQDSHSGRIDNPHGVTAAQAGADPAGSAAGAEQAAKDHADTVAGQAQSAAEQHADAGIQAHESALNPHPQYATGGAQDSHSGRTDNPHGVTAAQAGADPTGSAAAAEQAAKDHADQGMTDHLAAVNPHDQYVEESTKGQADGVASLDAGGWVPVAQLPESARGDVTGPGGSNARAVPVFDDATGKLLAESGVHVDEQGNLFGHGSKITEYAGSSLILGASHKGKVVWCTNATQPIKIFAPDDATTPLDPGYSVIVVQGTNQNVTAETLGSDDLVSAVVPATTARIGSAMIITKRASGIWWVQVGSVDGVFAVAEHEARANPHPQYLQTTRKPIVINGDTTISFAHLGQTLRVSAGATITFPEDGTENLPEGFWVEFQRITNDDVLFAVQGSDQLESEGNGNAIANNGGWAAAMKMASGKWALTGGLKVVT